VLITFYSGVTFKNIEQLLCIDVFLAIEAATWSDENLSKEDKHSVGERPSYC